jgi:hypothetical protein
MIPVKLWKKYICEWDKEQREACKNYYKQKKYFEKRFKIATKNFKPWDDFHLLDILSVVLHAYKSYYSQDFNIFQAKDTEDFKNKIDSLTECCRMIDELSHFDAAHRLLEFEEELHREGTLAAEFQKKVRQQERALLAEKKKLKSDLFKTIALNYETWWD